jgi:ABC-type Fe3+ transport system permease subunit
MTEIILQFLSDYVYPRLVLIAIFTAAMVLAMIVDYYYGLKKAKENGIATTSKGHKKTCAKAQKYFSPYLVLVCVDLITCIVVPFPAFSMLWAAYCVFCEFVSVREKAWTKAELDKQDRTMSVIIENKEDIARLVAKLMTQQQEAKEAQP